MPLRQVTQFSEEFLASKAQIVVPRPLRVQGGEALNPLTIAADWTTAIELTTAWRTDITQSQELLNEEAIQYLTRPARTMVCTIMGRSDLETQVLSQILLSYATSNAPAPIYSDQVVVTGYEIEGSTLVVFGNFAYGHYFLGQRVVLLSTDIVKSRGENKAQWLQIQEISTDWIRLDSVPTRLPAIDSDIIVPCMDVDLVEQSTGLFVNDSILQAKVTWNESAGPETLPASYPPQAFNNLSPFVGYTKDGIPIFDFAVDWTGGINVSISRTLQSSPQGRSTVQAGSGRAYHIFDLNLLAKDRKQAWNHLRFFDGCRGRTGQFIYLHPNLAWKLYTPFPFTSTSAANIFAVGSRFDIQEHYKDVVFIRTNGEVHLRKVQQVVNVSDVHYRLELTQALPDTSFARVVPVHLSRLGQDSISQTWISDGISTSKLQIKECLDFSNSPIPDGDESLSFENSRSESAITVTDPDVWLSPASTGHSFNSAIGVYEAAYTWPARYTEAERCFDPREIVSSQASMTLKPKRAFAYALDTSHIFRYPHNWQNAGKAFVRNGMYAVSRLTAAVYTALFQPLPVAWDHLWDNTVGWTLILNLTPFSNINASPPYVSGECFRIMGNWVVATGAPLFVFFASNMPGAPGGILGCGVDYKDNNAVTRTVPFIAGSQFRNTSKPTTLTLRWSPSDNRLYCHINGINALTGGFFSTTGFYETDLYSEAVFGSNFVYGAYTPGFAQSNTWGDKGAVNQLLSWKRPLSDNEVNAIGADMARYYNGVWTNLSY